MTTRTARVEKLAALLDGCDARSHEPNLQPVHMVADLPVDADLRSCLRSYFVVSCGYHGAGGLVLIPVDDWAAEVARLPLFDAGFAAVADTSENAAYRRQIAAAIDDLVGASATVWRLDPSDSTGSMLTPTGGLHTYLVFESEAGRLFVDLDWTS